ncbi:hypothetical protein [Halococcus sp. IIIV-5B]|uniref:hypothetical protein n=1 Tax=Halococcus sp. IIIV-5B TaxID=2321230 RepID=UPI001F3F9491|nr:hypothetical protein [Halococcus sp. IIIV-5B]
MLGGGFGGVTPYFGPGRTLLQIRELVFEVEDIVEEVAIFFLSFGGALFEVLLRLTKLVILACEGVEIPTLLVANSINFCVELLVLGFEGFHTVEQLGYLIVRFGLGRSGSFNTGGSVCGHRG